MKTRGGKFEANRIHWRSTIAPRKAGTNPAPTKKQKVSEKSPPLTETMKEGWYGSLKRIRKGKKTRKDPPPPPPPADTGQGHLGSGGGISRLSALRACRSEMDLSIRQVSLTVGRDGGMRWTMSDRVEIACKALIGMLPT